MIGVSSAAIGNGRQCNALLAIHHRPLILSLLLASNALTIFLIEYPRNLKLFGDRGDCGSVYKWATQWENTCGDTVRFSKCAIHALKCAQLGPNLFQHLLCL